MDSFFTYNLTPNSNLVFVSVYDMKQKNSCLINFLNSHGSKLMSISKNNQETNCFWNSILNIIQYAVQYMHYIHMYVFHVWRRILHNSPTYPCSLCLSESLQARALSVPVICLMKCQAAVGHASSQHRYTVTHGICLGSSQEGLDCVEPPRE